MLISTTLEKIQDFNLSLTPNNKTVWEKQKSKPEKTFNEFPNFAAFLSNLRDER